MCRSRTSPSRARAGGTATPPFLNWGPFAATTSAIGGKADQYDLSKRATLPKAGAGAQRVAAAGSATAVAGVSAQAHRRCECTVNHLQCVISTQSAQSSKRVRSEGPSCPGPPPSRSTLPRLARPLSCASSPAGHPAAASLLPCRRSGSNEEPLLPACCCCWCWWWSPSTAAAAGRWLPAFTGMVAATPTATSISRAPKMKGAPAR